MKLAELLLEMPSSDLQKAETAIDVIFRDLGLDVQFSQHFKNRVLDDGYEARDTQISARQVFRAFNALKIKYGDKLMNAKNNKKEFIAILKDMSTDVNIPFVIDYDKAYNGLHKLTATTLMVKKNFRPNAQGGEILPVSSK